MRKTIIVTDTSSRSFDEKVNALTSQGWSIIPESLKISVSTTSNAWLPDAQTETVFGVVLEKEE